MLDSIALEVTAGQRLLAVSAEPLRWRILHLLTNGPLCVCVIQEQLEIPANLLSYHLGILRKHGLVSTRREGRQIHYSLAHDAGARLCRALPVSLLTNTPTTCGGGTQ